MEKKQDGREIILEALEWGYNEERRDNMNWIHRLFDFSTWGLRYGLKGRSAALIYLTDRLMAAEAGKMEREKYEYELYRAAEKAVGMYGPEAVEKFHEYFKRFV